MKRINFFNLFIKKKIFEIFHKTTDTILIKKKIERIYSFLVYTIKPCIENIYILRDIDYFVKMSVSECVDLCLSACF